jgi:hypothetical protein
VITPNPPRGTLPLTQRLHKVEAALDALEAVLALHPLASAAQLAQELREEQVRLRAELAATTPISADWIVATFVGGHVFASQVVASRFGDPDLRHHDRPRYLRFRAQAVRILDGLVAEGRAVSRYCGNRPDWPGVLYTPLLAGETLARAECRQARYILGCNPDILVGSECKRLLGAHDWSTELWEAFDEAATDPALAATHGFSPADPGYSEPIPADRQDAFLGYLQAVVADALARWGAREAPAGCDC